MSTPTGGQLRLAGTLEIGPLGLPWMRQRLAMLATGARRYLNGIDGARAVADWAGYRPCTSDGMPVIGWAPHTPGLYVATGHAMMGMTLGPVTGEIVAQQICGEPARIEPDYLAAMATVRYARKGVSHSRAAPLTPEASPNLA
jgi:D-amino-acid dehydrogenase